MSVSKNLLKVHSKMKKGYQNIIFFPFLSLISCFIFSSYAHLHEKSFFSFHMIMAMLETIMQPGFHLWMKCKSDLLVRTEGLLLLSMKFFYVKSINASKSFLSCSQTFVYALAGYRHCLQTLFSTVSETAWYRG